MSVCLNHPDRAAAYRCAGCHKPICEECGVTAEGQVFCSDRCAEGYLATREGVANFAAGAARRRRARIVRWCLFLLLLALAWLAYRHWR